MPDDLGRWLAEFNDEWVTAAHRLSWPIVVDLLEIAGVWFDDYLATADLDAIGGPVSWAGPEPAPVWFDIAREYTERWVHQQQIREAVGRPVLLEAPYAAPVIATFVHTLPAALSAVPKEEGTAAEFRVDGGEGGSWHVVRERADWRLRIGSHPHPDATVITDVEGAWRLFTRHPATPAPTTRGDRALAAAICSATAIIV